PRGARVRVIAPTVAPEPAVAQVMGVRGDSLVLRDPYTGREQVLPLDAVQALEIGAGRSRTRSTLRGAAIGAGVGAVAIGALGYAAVRDDTQSDPGLNALWMGGFFGAPLGGALGGLAGWSVGTERWVRLPPLTGVTVAPGRDGTLALGLARPAP
ncbi:MAG TPA: hypothetical protein VGR37_14610, partial [Longimicrobiaceae bacterium]|nr:hypothetical protein [Longimicrobiaceae bacterium]